MHRDNPFRYENMVSQGGCDRRREVKEMYHIQVVVCLAYCVVQSAVVCGITCRWMMTAGRTWRE